MASSNDSLALLNDPVAMELLTSRSPARLAYTWLDGTPRVVPIWFHWNGSAIVLATPPMAPKVKALQNNPTVAITIDSEGWPYHVLLVRGSAQVSILDDVPAEYVAASERYLGPEMGAAIVSSVRGQPTARISVEPEQVTVIDFETRFPSAMPHA
ncbi:MAG: pyridoxamine 5'-phosphate oxidase family protein [Dermatophilaceae bacterium]